MLLQKLAGITLIICGITSAVITNDGTAAALLIPMGAYTAITKEKVMQFPEQKERCINVHKKPIDFLGAKRENI